MGISPPPGGTFTLKRTRSLKQSSAPEMPKLGAEPSRKPKWGLEVRQPPQFNDCFRKPT
jgi:hypothetical protein